eukprot:gnl/Chilomastix_caulleri/987.p1 GENE.gnl/Chilomastix_caulleri/987~~gnl/Chilomastix_caulleri/987.p1  ORF type:complete len:165 (+),score=58.68 gnl/Chilomastix_caulleri/987:132-626(+)
MRLTDCVPIYELVTERELVKERLAQFLKLATDSSRLFANSRRLLSEDKERSELEAKLTAINGKLIPLIKRYEAKWNVIYRYNNTLDGISNDSVGYLDIIGKDIREMARESERSNLKQLASMQLRPSASTGPTTQPPMGRTPVAPRASIGRQFTGSASSGSGRPE